MRFRFEYFTSKSGDPYYRIELKTRRYDSLTRAIQVLCRGVESLENKPDAGGFRYRIECAKLYVDGEFSPVEIIYPHSLDVL